MKRSMLAIFAAFALLLAAPVLAQESNLTENEAQQEVNDNRTQPDADSTTGDSALTITGTVHSWTDDQIALKTDTGVHHIKVLPNTDWDGELTVGESVSIDYTRTGQGIMIAELVRSQGQVQTESTVVETTTTSTNTDMDMDDDMDVDVEANANLDTDWNDGELDAEADVTADFDADDELPATGSELPLLGLLGLLSLVAAIGIRTFR